MEEETVLLELLEITSEEIVERFQDRIEEKQETIRFKEGIEDPTPEEDEGALE
jgi:hypothetical protein